MSETLKAILQVHEQIAEAINKMLDIQALTMIGQQQVNQILENAPDNCILK